MKRSFGFGLVFESEMDIPGATTVANTKPADDVVRITVERGSDVKSIDQLYIVKADCLTFSPPGVGTYRISKNSVSVSLWPDADIEFARDLLVATALPGLLWLRGGFMLHAAGVVIPGQSGAVAIVGPSGAGKSTIAKMLIDQGASLVGDDSLCIGVGTGGITATGLAGGLFLGRGEERTFHAINEAASTPEVALAVVIILSDMGSAGPASHLKGVAAVETLLANRHRPAIPALLGHSRYGIEMASSIARSVPVMAWHRGSHGDSLDPVRIMTMIDKLIAGE